MDLISVVAYVTGTCRDLQAIQPIYRILYLDRGVVNIQQARPSTNFVDNTIDLLRRIF